MLYMEVSVNAIKSNIEKIRKVLGNRKLYAVIKANAYGVGFEIAKVFEKEVDGLCVANAYELNELRKLGVKAPVLILGRVENFDYDNNSIVSISSIDEMKKLKRKRVAIKINTGMNRRGCEPEKFEKLYFATIKSGCEVDSVFSHLYNAQDEKISQNQYEIFEKATSFLSGKVKRHLCASNCLITPTKYLFDGARVGLALYGYGYERLTPAVRLYGVIEQINNVLKGQNIGYGNFVAPKNMRVATVSVGYGDGVSANAKIPCEINGIRCYSVGRICMDFLSVDVSEVKCKVGDRAYFSCGSLSLDEFASAQNKILHETLCALSARVRRKYCDR